MSYVESTSWTQGWKLVLGLFIFVILLSVLFRGPRPAGVEDVAAALDANPQIHETTTALRELYPRDHRRLVERLSDALRRGGNTAAADREAGAFMKELMITKVDAIASAPDAELRAVAAADLAAAQSLQRSDVALCAAFMGDGLPPGSRPSAEAMALIDHAAALRLRAAHAGEALRMVRISTVAASRAWMTRLAANDAASAALISSRRIDSSPPEQQCRAGIALYQAALDLPPAQGGEVIANLFRSALTG